MGFRMFADPHRNIESGDSCPHTDLFCIGDPALLARPSLALLCSAHAPAGILLAVHDLTQMWRQQGPLIMSGFQSVVEGEALAVLIRGPRPVVLWLARGVYRRIPLRLQPALDDGRLLIGSPFTDSVGRASRATAHHRNRLLCVAADAVLIAHAESGSQSESLTMKLIAEGKKVYTLEHQANANLVSLGAEIYAPYGPMI